MSKYSVVSSKKTQEAINSVLERARTDKDFRELVLNDPKKAIKQETGIDVPGDLNIKTVDNAGADMTVVVPDYEDPNAELSEADLEHAAGGADWCGIDCGLADIGGLADISG